MIVHPKPHDRNYLLIAARYRHDFFLQLRIFRGLRDGKRNQYPKAVWQKKNQILACLAFNSLF